ncbi:MAG: peptide chain release factor 1 [Firmicutes bacterium]|jgi:peptide chain release factor 1|nr:peptide chain release factor 1 [Bacillota bacterium]MDD4336202.1 peptide chain release factor 1 [Bacillota bacterium]MDD4792773.1 peptide chain release factor 1 [Bacillota bacterium]
MIKKLNEIEARYVELEQQLADPAVIADQVTYRKLAKAHSDLEEIVTEYRKLKDVMAEIESVREMLGDQLEPELRELADEELDELESSRIALEGELKVLLLPSDPRDEKNVIVEIRAGTGGDEAALFAGDLFRMYARYAERHGWELEGMVSNPTELGGFKEIIFMISGDRVYSRLKYESGVHRVQRVPETEASGRIHTSAATVAVLPEAEEVDVEIDPNDLKIDVFRSSGHGGQSVNTTDSAVRVTHVPTGMVVTCQDEKSQHKNRDKAMKVLRARLLEQLEEEREADIAETRKSQVGSGDRSERIRTYNFPQSRVSDHRIGFTTHRLDGVLDGELDEIIEALILNEQGERLKRAE